MYKWKPLINVDAQKGDLYFVSFSYIRIIIDNSFDLVQLEWIHNKTNPK